MMARAASVGRGVLRAVAGCNTAAPFECEWRAEDGARAPPAVPLFLLSLLFPQVRHLRWLALGSGGGAALKAVERLLTWGQAPLVCCAA
jgi:hypothetical protein